MRAVADVDEGKCCLPTFAAAALFAIWRILSQQVRVDSFIGIVTRKVVPLVSSLLKSIEPRR